MLINHIVQIRSHAHNVYGKNECGQVLIQQAAQE